MTRATGSRFAQFLLVWVVLLASVPAYSTSAYLPLEGRFSLSGSYIFETFDEFWRGRKKTRLPDDIHQHTVSVGLEYGLLDDVALDLTLGYTRTSFSPVDDLDGLNDTSLGVRWRILNEFRYDSPYVPTLTLRLGGIIEGSYDTVTTGAPNSPGDGASGVETSLLFGKIFDSTNIGLSGDIGYRHRGSKVPDDFFVSVGLDKIVFDYILTGFHYRHTQGLSGIDIGSPSFDPSRFPEVREISDNVQAELGYVGAGGQYFGVIFAWTIAGRNTGEKFVLGPVASFPF
jgi:hypothetical protein